MELCVAVLLSELTNRVINALNINFNKIVIWTESTITLSWIKSQPNTLKIFESHRVATIQQLTSEFNWCHIRSKQNPADFITRGQSLQDLMNNNIWWNGPSILHQEIFIIDSFLLNTNFNPITDDDLSWLFFQCSDYIKLIKSVGYWLRAKKKH
jgi:hypothetical protein